MSPDEPTSPFSFAEPSQSSLGTVTWPSDFESENDDTSRAAKRRKIERLARDYLEGKPLFIFSASLKGPFNSGWVNPWERSRRPQKDHDENFGSRETEPSVPNTVALPDTTSKPIRDFVPSRGPPFPVPNHSVSQASKSRIELSQQKADHRNWEQVAQEPRTMAPGFAPISKRLSIERHRSTSQHTSDNEWLKRDRKPIDRLVKDCPRSPSPTPVPRRRRDASQKPMLQARNASSDGNRVSDSSNLNPTDVRVSGFHPINAFPIRDTESSPLAEWPESESPPEKPQKSVRHANDRHQVGISPLSMTTAVRQPGSRNEGHVDNEHIKAQPNQGPTTKQSENLTEVSTHTVLPDDSFQYHRGASVSQDSKQTRIVSKVTKMDSNRPRACVKLNEATSRRCMPSLRLNTSVVSNEWQERKSTATTSGNLPSAQVISEQATYPHQMISLHSTEYLASNGMLPSPTRAGLDHLSTQAATAIAQKSAQDDLVNSTKAPTSEGITKSIKPWKMSTTKSTTPVQIKPFCSFNTQKRNASNLHGVHPASRKSSSQGIINSIIPCGFSTAKNVQFGSCSEQDVGVTDGSRTRNSDIDRSVNERQPRTEAINHQKPSAACPTSSHSSKTSATSLPTRQPEDSCLESLGTALPFTLTASTAATRQQDGQGYVVGFDHFDLDQAIADAGSFLQGWELHANVSFQTNKTIASSAGRATQSILRTNADRNY
ncbi:hypothetical protein PRK78_002354 [Emydomyces testavorans]|uniref:Uncharacterized protein n=1 Tax=Emydomyces testavorans TaxID=2070801 RepID=A0AAF0DE56_9EURO|nr:hypothetical protein PRK78_002354 [Emydomyces testavorans]